MPGTDFPLGWACRSSAANLFHGKSSSFVTLASVPSQPPSKKHPLAGWPALGGVELEQLIAQVGPGQHIEDVLEIALPSDRS